jgi:hypothetical protein
MGELVRGNGSEPDWGYIIDRLGSFYIGSRGLSIINEMESKWKKKNTLQPMTCKDTFSLINVALDKKKSSIFNFVFDDVEEIKQICREIGKTGSEIFIETSDLDEMDYSIIYIVATNEENRSKKELKELMKHINNKEVGLFLGYPESSVKAYTKDKNSTKSPRYYLDLTDDEFRKLHYLINYTVDSKEIAQEALREAKERYSKIEEIEKDYADYLKKRNRKNLSHLPDEEVNDILQDLDTEKYLTSKIDSAIINNNELQYNPALPHLI